MATISRDLYKREVDFVALAQQFPDFAGKLKANGQLDFSDPESVRQLTKCLLVRDFNLDIDLPEDRLCPPIPNRYNYILWVQDLIDSSRSDYAEAPDLDSDILGIDIGAGATCIYPLLGCRSRQNWKFYATEIDDRSFEYAARNISINSLSSKIKLIQTQPSDPLLPPSIFLPDSQRIAFTTLNPPFYASPQELASSASLKSRPPFSSCTGSGIEMIFPADLSVPGDPGGELSFVDQLLQQSSQQGWRYRVQWYTSLLGKLSSVSTLIEKIKKAGCSHYAVTEFVQGNRTRRWGLAWSYLPLIPSETASRGTTAIGRALLPPKTEVILDTSAIKGDSGVTISEVTEKLDKNLKALRNQGLTWSWDPTGSTGIGKSPGNVWGRKARRARKFKEVKEHIPRPEVPGNRVGREPLSSAPRTLTAEENVDVFVFRLRVRASARYPLSPEFATDSTPQKGKFLEPERSYKEAQGIVVTIHIRWLHGQDAVVFESFCEMMRRSLT